MVHSTQGDIQRSTIHITVRHGSAASADTVVRAMNEVNGKCRFSGSDSSETLWRIFKKILHSWLCRRPHPTRKSWSQSVQFKGGLLRPLSKLAHDDFAQDWFLLFSVGDSYRRYTVTVFKTWTF